MQGDPGWVTGANAGGGGGVLGVWRSGCSGVVAGINAGMGWGFLGVLCKGGALCSMLDLEQALAQRC